MAQPQRVSPPEQVLFSEAADPGLASPRFWAQLVSYRPVIMLAMLWLVLVSVAAIAYSRLMFTEPPVPVAAEAGKVPQAPAPRDSLAAPPPSDPAPEAPAAGPEAASLEASLEPSVPDPASGQVPLWSIGLMIGACALGSWLVSQQLTAPPRPSRRRSPKASGEKARPGTGQSASPRRSGGPKRLEPYSPERDQILVPGAAAPTIAAKPATPAAPTAPEPAPVATPPATPRPRTAASGPEVTVLETDEFTPLDWPDGGLAHNLDVRQRRSLSSYL